MLREFIDRLFPKRARRRREAYVGVQFGDLLDPRFQYLFQKQGGANCDLVFQEDLNEKCATWRITNLKTEETVVFSIPRNLFFSDQYGLMDARLFGAIWKMRHRDV